MEIAGGSMDYASYLAKNLNDEPHREVLNADFKYDDYDEQFIKSVFAQLDDPTRMTFILGSVNFDIEQFKDDIQQDRYIPDSFFGKFAIWDVITEENADQAEVDDDEDDDQEDDSTKV